MSTEAFEFHDGTLESIHVSGDGSIRIICNFYSTPDAKNRLKFTWNCLRVVFFCRTLDFMGLLDNSRAGNINDGRFISAKRGMSHLKIFFLDGYLEIDAKSIDVHRSG